MSPETLAILRREAGRLLELGAGPPDRVVDALSAVVRAGYADGVRAAAGGDIDERAHRIAASALAEAGCLSTRG